MNERNSEMRMQHIDENFLDEALKNFCAHEEKMKKIRCMSSTQRKRHQRQFAVMHFLLNGMKQFIGNISMDTAQEKRIIIVSDHKSRQAAELLSRQIENMKDDGFAFTVQLYLSNEFQKLCESDPTVKESYIICIGFFPESERVLGLVWNWNFNRFGFRYGWFCSTAVIMFDREPTTEEFSQMVSIAETEFAKAKHEVDMLSKLEGNFWYELSTTQKILIGTGIVALAFIGIGGALAVSAGEKNKCCKKSHKSNPNTEYLPKGRIDYLTAKQIEDLNHKTNMEEITDEEWDYMNDVSPEYAEDWLDRDEGLWDMSLEEYDELRDFSDYSGIDFEDVVYWKS